MEKLNVTFGQSIFRKSVRIQKKEKYINCKTNTFFAFKILQAFYVYLFIYSNINLLLNFKSNCEYFMKFKNRD